MKSALQGFHRNLISLAAGEATFRALGLVISAVVARRLGVNALGVLLVAQSVVWYALVVGDAGLSVDGTRRLAGRLESPAPLIVEITAIQAFVSIVAIAIVAAVASLLPIQLQAKHILLFLLPIPLLYALNLAYVLQSRRRMLPVSIGRVIGQLAATAIALVGVIWFNSLVIVAIAITIGQLLTDAVLIAVTKAEWSPVPRPHLSSMLERLKHGQSYLLYALVNHFNSSTPLVATALLGGVFVIGTYGVVNRLVLVCVAPVILIAQVTLPRFSADLVHPGGSGKARLRSSYSIVLGAMFALLFAGLVPLLLFPQQILELLFGPQAGRATSTLRVALLFLPFSYFNALSATALLALDRATRQSCIAIAGAAVLVGALVLAVPLAGATGTAAALVISEGFMASLFLRIGRVIEARRVAILVLTVSPYLLVPAGVAAATVAIAGTRLWWMALPPWLGTVFLVELALRRVVPRRPSSALFELV